MTESPVCVFSPCLKTFKPKALPQPLLILLMAPKDLGSLGTRNLLKTVSPWRPRGFSVSSPLLALLHGPLFLFSSWLFHPAAFLWPSYCQTISFPLFLPAPLLSPLVSLFFHLLFLFLLTSLVCPSLSLSASLSSLSHKGTRHYTHIMHTLISERRFQ